MFEMVPVSIGTRNRLGRVAWGLVRATLYRWSPKPLHRWRCFLLRCFGADIAAGAHPYPRARIWGPWNLTMAARSGLADDVDCYCVARITIGVDATVSQYSYLCSAGHDPDDTARPIMPLLAAPIVIGDRAWVAAAAYIGPGVVVGADSIVGARATVVKDVVPGEIVAGNPARRVRMRAGWTAP